MNADIIGRRLLLGAGALALTLPRAKADTPFSSFAFQATGTPTARTLPDRLAEIKNVKDFGATGNGSTDDTAAIRAAVNYVTAPYSSARRGIIFFPTGVYNLSAPVTFETDTIHLHFLGAAGAQIIGNFADALLKRSPFSPIGGVHVIENLIFTNTHASGKGVMLHSCVTAGVRNCQFSGGAIGIETYNSQCVTLDTCTFIGHTAIGVMAGNATTLLNCDVTHCGEGVRHHNIGLVVLGGRFEMNTVAIMLGRDQDGNTFQSVGFDIRGLSMEANQTAIHVHAGGAGNISSTSASGGIDMAYGLNIEGIGYTCISGVSIGGRYSGAGIKVGSADRLVFMGVLCTNASGTAWSLPTNLSLISFIQTPT